MRRFRAALLGLVLAVMGPSVRAEEILDPQSLTNARRQGWIQFGLRSGRIVVTGSRGVNFNTAAPGSRERRERLSIRVTGTDPVITYELTTPTQQFFLDASAGNRLQLRRIPKEGRSEPVPVEFRQAPHEPICLKVGAKEQERVYRAASIWHLFVLEPDASRTYLALLLKIVLREWEWAKMAAEIESILIRTAEGTPPPDRKRWGQWVQQLGDPQFAKREAADRQLREAGRVVVTYLEQLDPARLDAEQQFRIRRILQALADAAGDESPSEIATWLAGDPAIWFALLSRPEEPTRRVAQKRLEAMLGEAIGFDAAADPTTRARQLDALRPRVFPK